MYEKTSEREVCGIQRMIKKRHSSDTVSFLLLTGS